MSAVLAAMFADHETAANVRTRLVEDGFPTDRVELASRTETGQSALVPADSMAEKLTLHFQQLFPAKEDADATRLLCQGVLQGRGIIAVHPRGDIETQRALRILESAGPLELRATDLENQSLERAASPSDETVIPNVRRILLGPGQR
ncbi:MAG TPA: hypothetical protein VHB68_15855 [Steroidobacteraceae bacterium]|nr:hypothetical protein [Steroidobacteraceae bacterium]